MSDKVSQASAPYLILHKVRGEPAFDVAEKHWSNAEDEVVWIVSTSGHRAYPQKHWLLGDLADVSDINWNGGHNRPANFEYLDEGLPDHYACNDKPMAEDKYQVQREAVGLLTALGLVKKVEADRRD